MFNFLKNKKNNDIKTNKNKNDIVYNFDNINNNIFNQDIYSSKITPTNTNFSATSHSSNDGDKMSIMEIKNKIAQKADEIIKKEIILPKQNSNFNEIAKFFNIDEKMYEIFKIFKYIVTNAKYDYNAFIAKRQDIKNNLTLGEVIIKDIYRCLCENATVCSGYATAMAYLLKKIGIKASHETISPPNKDKNRYHEVVVFENQGKTYISDPTLIRLSIDKGILKKATISNFCYDRETYFTKIRPNWETVAKYKIDIDNYKNYYTFETNI